MRRSLPILGHFFASVDTFNPLTSTDSALAEILKGAYSRGVWGMKLEFNSYQILIFE